MFLEIQTNLQVENNYLKDWLRLELKVGKIAFNSL